MAADTTVLALQQGLLETYTRGLHDGAVLALENAFKMLGDYPKLPATEIIQIGLTHHRDIRAALVCPSVVVVGTVEVVLEGVG